MSLLEQIKEKAFLGTEFVTWLWYHSESGEGAVPLLQGGECELSFSQDLLLVGDSPEAENSALKGGAPSLAPEAATALAAGKKVRRAKIHFTRDQVLYSLAVNGETFDWSGLKIDVPPSLPFEEAVPLRLNALEDFHRIFAGLFETYLNIRLDPEKWEPEVQRIRAWVREKDEREDRESTREAAE